MNWHFRPFIRRASFGPNTCPYVECTNCLTRVNAPDFLQEKNASADFFLDLEEPFFVWHETVCVQTSTRSRTSIEQVYSSYLHFCFNNNLLVKGATLSPFYFLDLLSQIYLVKNDFILNCELRTEPYDLTKPVQFSSRGGCTREVLVRNDVEPRTLKGFIF